MIKGRGGIIAVFVVVFIFVIFHIADLLPGTSLSEVVSNTASSIKDATNSQAPLKDKVSPGTIPIPVPAKDESTSTSAAETYFSQVFAQDKPIYSFPELKAQCDRTKWPEDDVYLQCGGMSAGITSIMSQVKVCLKMAVEAGTGIILPAMPLRDSANLQEFNFNNADAYLTYDQWFDVDHFRESIARVCPGMKVLHPNELEGASGASGAGVVADGGSEVASVPVKNMWNMDLSASPGYLPFAGHFWAGKPFKDFFDKQLAALEEMASWNPDKDDGKKGITIVSISSQFLIFRITDDPTQHDLRLWNDLGMLIRFKEEPRKIVDSLLQGMGRPFYGVHFRVESDTIWSGLDHQLSVDLDALDLAWETFGSGQKQQQEPPIDLKPLVYLACGDQLQIAKFVEAGALRGWEVTHKWDIATKASSGGDTETLEMINQLPFDFQGAVDMGIMVKSEFFLGITGSAFSSSIGNARDETGRYRGSSFVVWEDGGARTHLFNDGDAGSYACCL